MHRRLGALSGRRSEAELVFVTIASHADFKAKLKRLVLPWIRKRGQDAFVLQLPEGARVLDVSCGTASPFNVKALRPDLYYVGLDIRGWDQMGPIRSIADKYHQTSPDTFDEAVRASGFSSFDAVISSHNIEHTRKPLHVLDAMCDVLRPGGMLYLAFPSELSITLPHRYGTLNFLDDETHVWLPPYETVLGRLRQNNVQPVYHTPAYRPIIYLLIGALTEPYSAIMRRVGPFGGTWALYGFESVIWARKMSCI